MKYNCRYCKMEWDTVQSNLRCKCGADLDESIRLAEKQWMEEQKDLQADTKRRGLVWNEKRSGRT